MRFVVLFNIVLDFLEELLAFSELLTFFPEHLISISKFIPLDNNFLDF